MEATKLLLQAERCRRLARSIYNADVAADLETYARQLEERVDQLALDVTEIFPNLPGAREP